MMKDQVYTFNKNNDKNVKKLRIVDSTRTSPVVTHPSTTRAWGCLTSQSRRDTVLSA